jgi:hypothetical protein
MKFPIRACACAVLLPAALGACAYPAPVGPSIAAMPGTGKTFEQFQADDGACRQFASYQTGGMTPSQAATNAGIGSAAVGTVLGAGAGALIGAAAGNPGAGAAIGAASGLLLGSSAGVGNAQASGAATQAGYDNAYMQCMYAKGEKVPSPVYARPAPAPAPYAYAPAPAPYAYAPAPYYPYYYRPYRYYYPY